MGFVKPAINRPEETGNRQIRALQRFYGIARRAEKGALPAPQFEVEIREKAHAVTASGTTAALFR